MTIHSICFHATIMEIFYRGSLLGQAVASFARHLSGGGFNTWILEIREAGLNKREGEPTSTEIGGTDGDLSGAVQDAFIQAIIKTATKATEVKRDGIMAVLNTSRRRRHLSSNQMA